MSNIPKIVYNAIQTPDGTILESRYRHDYIIHKDANGEVYMVDGGLDYVRRRLNKEPYKDLSVYTDDDHSVIREVFSWGTRGLDGCQPLKYIRLKDITDDHLNAIIATQGSRLQSWILKVFNDEIEWRKI